MNEKAQLRDDEGPLVICRGCELSGEVEVGHGQLCELCESAEPLTVEVIHKLVDLIPVQGGRRAHELLQGHFWPRIPSPPVKPFDQEAYFERIKQESRASRERIAELLVANTRYKKTAQSQGRKLDVAMRYLKSLTPPIIWDGVPDPQGDYVERLIVEIERMP